MFFAQLNLSLLEISLLLGCAIILGFTVRFFLANRKAMKEVMKPKTHQPSPVPDDLFLDPLPVRKQMAPAPKTSRSVAKTASSLQLEEPLLQHKAIAAQLSSDAVSPQAVSSLKNTLLKQRETLQQLLEKVDTLEDSAQDRNELKRENENLQQKVEELEIELEIKESELKKAKQQEAVAQQMAARIDEVYKEFELLQQKIAILERQANQGTSVTLELEDLQQSCNQLQKELVRKQDKLEEVIAENQRLHQMLSVTEDKLVEANLQRQQLLKKVQYLQGVNTDIQNVNESNHKLQKELRRIGELESMLNLMTEERERLSKSKR